MRYCVYKYTYKRLYWWLWHINQESKYQSPACWVYLFRHLPKTISSCSFALKITPCNICLQCFLRVCAREDTLMILAGAELLILSRSKFVSRKWPRWFTPNCISKPSCVFQWGHIIIPINTRKCTVNNMFIFISNNFPCDWYIYL